MPIPSPKPSFLEWLSWFITGNCCRGRGEGNCGGKAGLAASPSPHFRAHQPSTPQEGSTEFKKNRFPTICADVIVGPGSRRPILSRGGGGVRLKSTPGALLFQHGRFSQAVQQVQHGQHRVVQQ